LEYKTGGKKKGGGGENSPIIWTNYNVYKDRVDRKGSPDLHPGPFNTIGGGKKNFAGGHRKKAPTPCQQKKKEQNFQGLTSTTWKKVVPKKNP